jgi:hypothetical protein
MEGCGRSCSAVNLGMLYHSPLSRPLRGCALYPRKSPAAVLARYLVFSSRGRSKKAWAMAYCRVTSSSESPWFLT